jgi:flagellar biosynthesis protein FlhF
MEGAALSVRTYKAYSLAEALAAVRQDLGVNAVILRTRSTRQGGILGIGRRTVVEVIAQSGDAHDRAARFATPGAAKAGTGERAAARRAYAATAGPSQAPALSDRERTKRLAQAILERHERERAADGRGTGDRSHERKPAAPPERDVAAKAGSIQPQPVMPVARRFTLRSPAGEADDAASAPAMPASVGGMAMQEELSAIRDMVGRVLQRQAPKGASAAGLPGALFDMYLRLIAQDVSEELAEQMIDGVRAELDERQLQDEAAVRGAVLRRLATYVPTVDGDFDAPAADGRPLTIALVGPTGVGKTTTLAKLAASYKLRHGRRVGLITSDTYRIAAVDQLRTYANIIGLPLEVALTPADMAKAADALRDREIILIDTAGRGQNDRGRLEELRQFLAAASPHEIHLVLSSTASEKALLREAKAFAAVGADRVLLTKLDEAVSFGVLVNVMRHLGKKLSFVTTGQEVPDHIEPGRSDRLAELVLAGGWRS